MSTTKRVPAYESAMVEAAEQIVLAHAKATCTCAENIKAGRHEGVKQWLAIATETLNDTLTNLQQVQRISVEIRRIEGRLHIPDTPPPAADADEMIEISLDGVKKLIPAKYAPKSRFSGTGGGKGKRS